MNLPIPASQKWLVLGVKALITVAALIPSIRSSMQAKASEQQRHQASPFKPITGSFGLVFMGRANDAIATVQLDYAVASQYFVDKQKIQSLARYYRAYAVAIHCDDLELFGHGPFSRQHIMTTIADALREIGVNVVPDMNAC